MRWEMNQWRRWRWAAFWLSLLAIAGSACAAEDQNNQTASPKSATASEQSSEKPDPFLVPDGSPEELLDYVQSLKTLEPRAADLEAMTVFRQKLGRGGNVVSLNARGNALDRELERLIGPPEEGLAEPSHRDLDTQ